MSDTVDVFLAYCHHSNTEAIYVAGELVVRGDILAARLVEVCRGKIVRLANIEVNLAADGDGPGEWPASFNDLRAYFVDDDQ